jgi:hypothetical protein
VILENRSVASWCADLRERAGKPVTASRAQQVLLSTLDRLVEHYDVGDGRRGARAA